MKKFVTYFFLYVIIILSPLFSYAQFISPNEERDNDFKKRMEAVKDKSPFKIFEDPSITGERLEALKFLYAYMPLSDVLDYTPEFILENVDASLRALEEMPWGKNIPEQEFLYFTLPIRANNESLDSSRMVFFEELKERVKEMSIQEAILETNHWCHEKVSYRASDGRTSSPLSSMSQAIGRCGEESTFAVAALRSIGIPARQVYTPRWAHTDDNHAWVEAYADGEWHFLGACEPEPVLDLGWFNEPSSRGILMNTNVIGKYNGPEEKLSQNNLSTTINVTSNYTDTDSLKIKVIDLDGLPVENCKVNFCVYNYAEFYPVATKLTDSKGKASLIAGHGDMIIWATDGVTFGFTTANSKNDSVSIVTLNKPENFEGEFDFTIVPSPPKPKIPYVSEEARRINDRRFAIEDSIRNAYISTFATQDSATSSARSLGVDTAKLTKILLDSRGNHKNILNYLESLSPELRNTAINILLAVTEKDRRDIPIVVLEDNLANLSEYPDSTILNDYILNPRIEREPLFPYKSFLKQQFSNQEIENFKKNPSSIVNWVNSNITLSNLWNPRDIRMSPIAVWKGKEATTTNRNIFFVALSRSMGVPAKIDPVTSITQYMDIDGTWHDALFSDETISPQESQKSQIILDYSPVGRITDPLYYSQFSISRFIDGVPVQLEFAEEDRVHDINERQQELEPGKYMITSGQRMADGSVLGHATIFNIQPDMVLNVPLTIPQDTTQIQVIGSLNAENIYQDSKSDSEKSIISTTGRGYYIVGLVRPNQEPTKHALNDIILASSQLEDWGGKILLLFQSEEDKNIFDFSEFKDLPSNVVFGIDKDQNVFNELSESLGIDSFSSPVFVIADTFNRVVFVSTGYTIGLGEKLLDVLSRISIN